MSELDVVGRTTGEPATVETLTQDLVQLGVRPGMVLLVHSSLSALGWVCGGAVAVVKALEKALGQTGTLMMPTHSWDLSNPANWEAPPVPQTWWETIRDQLPAYDPDLTPTRGMGVVVDCFRSQRGTLRSSHPQVSFAARGTFAEALVGEHPLSPGLGENSPLGALYRLDGYVLLLGVGHDRNTSLHLAEHRAEWPAKRRVNEAAPINVDGRRVWRTYQDQATDSADFAALGADYGSGQTGSVACAEAVLLRQRPLVDFGVQWIETHRA